MMIFFWVLVLLLPLLWAGCNKDNATGSASAPTITGMTPQQVFAGQQNVSGRITGTNFTGTVGVDLGDGIQLTKTTVVGSTEISLRFSVDSTAVPGPRSIIVTTADGVAMSSTLFEVSANRLPVARFTTSPANGALNTVFEFDASASNDPDGTIDAYDWDFGDGQTGTGVTATHQYSEPGNYDVTLTVTDDSQGKDNTSVSLEVQDSLPPLADFTVSPDNGDLDTTFTFDASDSSDTDGTIVTYSWKFAGGSSFDGVVFQRKFPEPGTYTVTLTVTDNDGLQSSRQKEIVVTTTGTGAPIADFTVSPQTGDVSTTFTFDASDSSDADGTIVTYSWKFAGGSSFDGVVFQRKFPEPGTYTVTLTVTDDDGLQTSVDGDVEVTASSQGSEPIASFTISPQTGDLNTTFKFDASASSDADGSIVEYSWKFAGGSVYTGKAFQRKFPESGTYSLELTVTDNHGLTGKEEQDIVVAQGGTTSGQECTQPARRGPAYYGEIISVDNSNKSVVVELYEPASCNQAFYRCGDIRKGGDPTPPELWIGVICGMVDLGNNQFQVFLTHGNYWPTVGEKDVYLWYSTCTVDSCP